MHAESAAVTAAAAASVCLAVALPCNDAGIKIIFQPKMMMMMMVMAGEEGRHSLDGEHQR
jgi:hypothetical protein